MCILFYLVALDSVEHLEPVEYQVKGRKKMTFCRLD